MCTVSRKHIPAFLVDKDCHLRLLFRLLCIMTSASANSHHVSPRIFIQKCTVNMQLTGRGHSQRGSPHKYSEAPWHLVAKMLIFLHFSVTCLLKIRRITSIRGWKYQQNTGLYCAALNAGRSSHEKAVCPSICQTRALWQNRSKFCPDFYTIRKGHLA